MNVEIEHVWKEMVKTVVQQLICAGLFLSAYCVRFRVSLHLVDGRCVRVTTLLPSCAECPEILELNLPETPKATRPVV